MPISRLQLDLYVPALCLTVALGLSGCSNSKTADLGAEIARIRDALIEAGLLDKTARDAA